ncbi:hypothetical protein KUC3_04950 [Alteromonas sp. KC3]|uniref:hypothetical protein n=1 Tax=Alteromonas sp. KC3 TaxID=2795688 RepID=UPI001924A065|nr:hypothetical protein [Alteromonas sp. KC3]BCO17638.1 hypothetical protein KUC3_04950 [Alteromonas sp. KC3]
MISFADTFIPLVGFAISAFLAFKFTFKGLFVGVALVWLSFFARYELLTYLDETYETGILAAVTLGFTGWVLGFIWCLPFTVIRLIINSKKGARINNDT